MYLKQKDSNVDAWAWGSWESVEERWIFFETKSLFSLLFAVSVHVFLFFKHCGNPGCLVSYNSEISVFPRGKGSFGDNVL